MKRLRLHPESALCTASFWVGLSLLALNDHVLKGSGLWPAVVTGKLSDFAGMFVAPALLASLLRVRGERALKLCFVAVGAVFAAIQLDAAAAALWSSWMAAFGFPWTIVSDPWDLVALPALFAAYRLQRPAMQRRVSLPARRTVQRAGAAVGLLLCMATSDDTFVDDIRISAGPHLYNASGRTRVINLQPLLESVELDCDAIEDPGRLMPRNAFGPIEAFTVRRRGTLATRSIGRSDCSALLLSGDGLPPAVLFWRGSRSDRVPDTYRRESDAEDGAVILGFDRDEGVANYSSVGGEFVFELDESPVEARSSCGLPSAEERFGVDTDLPSGMQRLTGRQSGYDGCYRLWFVPDSADVGVGGMDAGVAVDDADAAVDEPTGADADDSDAGGEPPDAFETSSHYLCLPFDLFPFEVGDLVIIDDDIDSVARMRRVEGGRIVGPTLLMTRVGRARDIGGVTVSPVERDECPYQAAEGCAQVRRPLSLSLRGSDRSVELEPGDEPITLESSRGRRVTVGYAFGQSRILYDAACAEGSGLLGDDAEIVAVIEETEGL